MDFPLDCPTLEQINPEPLQDIYWPFMLPITVDATRTHYAPETPPAYQEPTTYTYLEPCAPLSNIPYPDPPSRYREGPSSVLTEDSVDCCSEGEVTGKCIRKMCFMNDEGLGSSSSSVSSTSPVDMLRADFSEVFVGERPSTSDSGCALDSFPVDVEPPMPQCAQCGDVTSIQWLKLESGHMCLQCFKRATAIQVPSITKRKKASVASEHRECSNCRTRHTSLWRRNADGNFNCNACGLYEKMNKMSRPITMRRDVIKRRQRKTKQASKKQKAEFLSETPHRFLLSSMLSHISDQRAYEHDSKNQELETYSPPVVLPSMDRIPNYYRPVSPVSSVSHRFNYENMLTNIDERSYYSPSNSEDLPAQFLVTDPKIHALEDTDS